MVGVLPLKAIGYVLGYATTLSPRGTVWDTRVTTSGLGSSRQGYFQYYIIGAAPGGSLRCVGDFFSVDFAVFYPTLVFVPFVEVRYTVVPELGQILVGLSTQTTGVSAHLVLDTVHSLLLGVHTIAPFITTGETVKLYQVYQLFRIRTSRGRPRGRVNSI